MERKAGASPSPWFPLGTEAEHSWLLLLSNTDWRWWWGCLDSGDNCWRGQEFSSKLTQDWGAEVWRVRTAWWLTFGFHWSGLPQMAFDSVEMKLTLVTWDAAHFLCVLILTWLFCWELSVCWVLTPRERSPYLGSLPLFALAEPDTATKGTGPRPTLGTCVFPCSDAWKSQTSALEGVWR